MKIAIRLDDITPGMDWTKFNRLKAMMDAAYVKPLIGVVPDCKDPKLQIEPDRGDFWEYVKALEEDSGWVIAMHGVHHVYQTREGGLLPLNYQSELAGLSFQEQSEMIAAGKHLLANHGILTDLYMAPSHSYDRNTLKALRENGFTKITDGFGKKPYTYEGMTFYPISFNKKSVLKDEGDGVVTLVIHTNTMTEKDFAFYEKVFREQNLIPYRELLYMEPAKKSAAGHLQEYWMARGKRFLVNLRKRKKTT